MRKFTFGLLALFVLAACSHTSIVQTLPPPPAGIVRDAGSVVRSTPRYRVCNSAAPGDAACFAILPAFSSSAVTPGNCRHVPGCYLASDLQAAYGVSAAAKTRGYGVTVGIVDAYGYDPTRDLKLYRQLTGLPACDKCLRVVNEFGGTALPLSGPWLPEEALDVEMVAALCPHCHILLVEAHNQSIKHLYRAEATALKSADIVTNSWGIAESKPTSGVFDTHPGKVVVASAGDDGAGAPLHLGGPSPETQPCGFTGVVCVGGTSLNMHGSTYAGETVWQDFHYVDPSTHHAYDFGATGSGCSALVAKPAWQNDTGCAMRSAADISADGDPLTGVWIVCMACTTHYMYGVGGTSVSSPLVAAMYALAGNATKLSSAPQKIWTSGGGDFHDVTSGFNDGTGLIPPMPSRDTRTGLQCSAPIAYICNAAAGYDGPTGRGSPNGLGAL